MFLRFVILLLAVFALGAGCAGPGQPGAVVNPAAEPAWPALLPGSLRRTAFRLAEVHERSYSTEFILTNRERVLKVEVIAGLGAEGARTMLDDGVMGVRALYANALSPYPGDISREVVSDRGFLPETVRTNWQGAARTFVLLYANARLGYGATTADAARYRSLIGWFHCEAADVFYKVRCFVPATAKREELEEIFRSIGCP